MNPLEFLYYAGYLFKKRRSLALRRKLPCPVISIGNITVGGTGKTPAAIAIADEAVRRGFSPAILTRGYRGKAKGPCLVSPVKLVVKNFVGDPHRVIHSVEDAGDEPVLMAEKLKGVPVIKSADRYEGGIFALQSFLSHSSKPFLFILDDGFQHWRLHRDVNIVLIDGLDPFGNRKLLPLGRLREPLGELKRADIFVVTKFNNKELAGELGDAWPGKPVYFAGHTADAVRSKDGAKLPLEALRNKKVFVFCGIAQPEAFRRTLLSLQTSLAGFKAYGDHHFYTSSDMDYLERQGRALQCEFMLTTEKDMVKLKELKIPDNVFSLEMTWDVDQAFYEDVFKRIAKGKEHTA